MMRTIRRRIAWLLLVLGTGLVSPCAGGEATADVGVTGGTLRIEVGDAAATVVQKALLDSLAEGQDAQSQTAYVQERLPGAFRPLARFSFLGFDLWRLVAAAFLILAALCLCVVITHLLQRLEKRKEKEEGEQGEGRRSFWHILLGSLHRPLQLVVWAVAIRLLFPVFAFSDAAGSHAAEIVLSVAVAFFIYHIVDLLEYYLLKYASRTESALDDMLIPMVRKTLRILVVIIAGLHLYQTVTGGSIATLIAGLGIGGLAVALAAQDTLKNIFGFVMIVLDRPFVIGERIDMDGHDGCVEQVGFRSTRIRRLDGHVVTVPNSKVADSVVHNIGRRPYIRRVMNVTITYDTPLDKVETAVAILRDILQDHEGMDPEFPPRVYFNELNADSLNIIAIYWYHPPAYWEYLDHCQRVNLELMRRYEAEGIEFAFPTQTLYLAGDPNRKLVLEGLNRPGELPEG